MLRHLTLAVCLLGAATVARADELTLTTGEKLQGTLKERTADKVVFEHKILGTLNLAAKDVKDVQVTGTEATDITPEPVKPTAEEAAAEKKRKAEEWKSRLEIGVSGAEGNSDNITGTVGVKSKKKDDDGTTKLDARFTYTESDGVETTNRTTAGAYRDWNLDDSAWSLFTSARYDRDRFAEWDQRGSISAGAGRSLYKTDERELKARLGASGTKEWGGSDDDHVRPEGLAGIDYEWQINKNQNFTLSSTYYPDLADGPEFRLVSSAEWTIKVDEISGLSLQFGVEHELDTHRVDPFKRQDVRYLALLIYDF